MGELVTRHEHFLRIAGNVDGCNLIGLDVPRYSRSSAGYGFDTKDDMKFVGAISVLCVIAQW